MATKVFTTEVVDAGKAILVKWLAMANGDDGSPYEGMFYADRSVQINGTFGAGGSCRIEGTNDSTNYIALTDPQGNALDLAGARIEAITEVTRKIRPHVTAGDGTTTLNVYMLIRKAP